MASIRKGMVGEEKAKERLYNEIDKMSKDYDVGSMAGCTTAQDNSLVPSTLIEKLRQERQLVVRRFNARIKEIDGTIEQLNNTEAERIVRDATEVLYKEI